VVAQGETSEMIASQDPFVRQFLHAQPDGPVPFHYPSKPYPEVLLNEA
jgi:phospholipid/cholesterol/gamma-HCH transport system ATP-binding protein